MSKDFLTWTGLCQRAKYIKEHRPEDYANLLRRGTNRFLTGYHVRYHSGMFRVSSAGKDDDSHGRALADFYGIRTEGGVYYTKIRPGLTPTSYKKRFWDKHMPVSFPNGLPKRGEPPACAFFYSGDEVEVGSVTLSQYRNEPARFSVQGGQDGWLMINDSTRQLVRFYHTPSQDRMDPCSYEQHSYEHKEYRWIADSFPAWSEATLEHTIRIAEGSCKNRDEWLASIVSACNAGLVNIEEALPLAARMWNAAYSFCQNHRDKNAYFYATPMRKLGWGEETGAIGCHPILEWKNTSEVSVEGEIESIPGTVADVGRWVLPSIVIHYAGDFSHHEGTHPFWSQPLLNDRTITMTLPPLGNPLMVEKPNYASHSCTTFVSHSAMRGGFPNHENAPSVPLQSDNALVVRYLERAYHGVVIINPDTDSPRLLRAASYRRKWNPNITLGEDTDNVFESWANKPGCVHVVSDHDEMTSERPDGPFHSKTEGGVGIAMTPEGATSMVEEQWLLASMPLS